MRNKQKSATKLAFLFALTYMISYITRINYGAVIAEMQSATGMGKGLLSMAVTGSFVTYGFGQLVSGVAGDKISPKRLVLFGFSITVLMNLLIPLCENPYYFLVVWSINGFAQSFMWPPIVKIMSASMTEEEYKIAVGRVSYGSSAGTIAVYLFSPLVIAAAGYKAVFIISAAFGIIMMLVWQKFAPEAEASPKAEKAAAEPKKSVGKIFLAPIMLLIMLSIILQGMLRDGVTTWMPSYISETYKLGTKISILTGVVLPIFSIICFNIATKLHIKKLQNPLSCAALFFALGTLSCAGLSLLAGKSAALSVLMSALLIGSMHSVNLMLICMIPNYFKSTGKVSTVSGILNCCTYIGSAASTYGIAILSEGLGWSFTIFSWLVIAALGTLICFLCRKPWDKFKNKI